MHQQTICFNLLFRSTLRQLLQRKYFALVVLKYRITTEPIYEGLMNQRLQNLIILFEYLSGTFTGRRASTIGGNHSVVRRLIFMEHPFKVELQI
jgi:hypothetical protein